VVPAYVRDVAPPAAGAVALICGPPVMIKFTLPELTKLGFADEQIITTLEMKMKCGVGKCGRCNIGKTYVCLDGPVFTYAQIRQFPPEF
jgi:NAD(P)H-flavin reductase